MIEQHSNSSISPRVLTGFETGMIIHADGTLEYVAHAIVDELCGSDEDIDHAKAETIALLTAQAVIRIVFSGSPSSVFIDNDRSGFYRRYVPDDKTFSEAEVKKDYSWRGTIMGAKEVVLGLPPFTLVAGEKYPDVDVLRNQTGSRYEDAIAIESVVKLAERHWMDKLVAFDGLKSIVRRFRERED